MKITNLAPKPQPGFKQCSHEVALPRGKKSIYMKKWREEHYSHNADPKKCQRAGTYEIDGDLYCSLHAGQIALDYMTGENDENRD
ncbi:hypothetical protein KAR91_51820 [Candidatus Pacearchaeota archaeon]|nr:hypothetical protein [Candidatus Pacearchaeota archaeon]